MSIRAHNFSHTQGTKSPLSGFLVGQWKDSYLTGKLRPPQAHQTVSRVDPEGLSQELHNRPDLAQREDRPQSLS